MQFSVLLSVYQKDDPFFLKDALESIYDNQTLKPNEIIIVFDGLLNNELYNVVNNFIKNKEEIVKTIQLEQNVGLGAALKIGTDYCKYDYIFRMDADDISHPRRFEKQIKYMKEHKNIDVLGSNISEFDTDFNKDEMRIRKVKTKHENIVEMAKKRNPMNHVTICMKKSALEKCGGYESVLLCEDYYLWLKMIFSGCKLENMNESLVYVRVGNGFTRKRSSKIIIKSWNKIQNYMLDNKLITRTEAFINMIYINCFVYMPSSIKDIIYKKILRN